MVPSPGATDLERLKQTTSKSCNCPMYNSMVSICGMLKLPGLPLPRITIRGYQCHTNKKTVFSILTNCIAIPDIPHRSKKPACIFHTWTILLSLKRKQKIFYLIKLSEIQEYPVSLTEMHHLLGTNLITLQSSKYSTTFHQKLYFLQKKKCSFLFWTADTILFCLEFQKLFFPNICFYAKALCCLKLPGLEMCDSMLLD